MNRNKLMLWNDYSFYLKVVFYEAAFFVIILQLMPLPNLPRQVLCAGTFSIHALMRRCIGKLLRVSAIAYNLKKLLKWETRKIKVVAMAKMKELKNNLQNLCFFFFGSLRLSPSL
jgi:hypothetical protein